MAQLGINPTFKVFNSNDLANQDGTINIYSTGTTTNVAAYYDADSIIKQKNPIKLNSIGETKLYLSDDQKHTLVIDDISSTTNGVEGIAPVFQLQADLDVNGQSIVSSSNGDIVIASGAGKHIILDGLKFPNQDGNAGTSIVTDGNGLLTMKNAVNIVEDTTPQLGGDLDTNTYNISFDTTKGIKDENGNEQVLFTTAASAVNYVNITNAATGNDPTIAVVGADSNINLNLSGFGAGSVSMSGYQYPQNDGAPGQSLTFNALGQVSFDNTATAVQHSYFLYPWLQPVTYLTPSIPHDDTIPQITEGDELFSKSITPTVIGSTIYVSLVFPLVGSNAAISSLTQTALFRNSAADAVAVCTRGVANNNLSGPLELEYEEVVSSLNEITFTVRCAPNVYSTLSSWLINGDEDARKFGGVMSASLIVEELRAP